MKGNLVCQGGAFESLQNQILEFIIEFQCVQMPVFRKLGSKADRRISGESAQLQNPLPQDKQTLGIARFNDIVRDDPRVESVILPLRDGLNIIRKKPQIKH